jgi:hypothetical protein
MNRTRADQARQVIVSSGHPPDRTCTPQAVDGHHNRFPRQALAPPAGRVHAGQEDVLHPPARSAQLHLAGAIDQSWQQSQQHREVPWLVEHVSGDHPVPGRPGKQRPGLVECAHGGLQRHYLCRRALCNDANEGDGPSRANLLSHLTCDDGRLAPLAGLEPATCCLGDV